MQSKDYFLQIYMWNFCSMLLRVLSTISYWIIKVPYALVLSQCCVSGTTWKYVVVKPSILILWPIQEGTNLTQQKETTLEEAWFSLNYNHVQSLFGS
jgi:hypothetical protein